MTNLSVFLILLSVAMICSGQLLFKLIGIRLNGGASVTDLGVASLAMTAMLIYGLATVLWIYVLKTTPLTKAYPYMALSFVIVPICSVLLFSEQVRLQYVVGTALIVAGVIVTNLSVKT